MRVFISYNHTDKKFANSLAEILGKKSIDFFLDSKSIEYGESISITVRKAFDNITHLVVVISPGSQKSSWVPFEIGIATGRNIPTIPILTHPAIELPDYLKGIKYFSSLDEFDAYFDKRKANTLQVEVSIKMLHCTDLSIYDSSMKGRFGFNEYNFDQNKPSPRETPFLQLEIQNKSSRSIILNEPELRFKSSQANIAVNSKIDAICLMKRTNNSEVLPGGKAQYYLFKRLIGGVVEAFINDNIEKIVISSVDGFNYEPMPYDWQHVKEYCQKYFNEFRWDSKIHGA
jgi:hypothetical protein